MNIKISTYAERLKKYYADYGDKESVEKISLYIDSAEKLQDDVSFSEIPRIKVAIESARARYMVAGRQLMTNRTLSERARDLLFVEMDWALWYVKNLGVNAVAAEKAMIDTLEQEMLRNGLSL